MKERYFEGASRMARLIIAKAEELKKNDGAVLVFPHKSVDGDCIGSSCAVTSNMGFLNVEDLLFYPSEDFADGDLLVNGKHYDQPFSVDCTEGHRMGDTNCRIFEIYEDALDIDHHEVTDLATENKWIDPGSSSACEMVFYTAVRISEILGKTLKDVIDTRCAKCLMAGIVTDTGRFTYTNTRPETLESAGSLMELGGDITDVCYNLFDLKTPSEFAISSAACSSVSVPE